MNPRKLRVENLEERTLLAVMAGGMETAVQTVEPTESAVWVVNTLEDSLDENPDDDIISLREAIERAADGDTVVFDEALAGGTIVLSDGLEIGRGITIDASGVGGVTVDGNQKWTCFAICADESDTPVELIGLTITGGNFVNGGGIDFFGGTLNLTCCTVTKNYANGNGGGIYQTETNTTLTLTDCTISENSAVNGGGIYNDGGTLTITDSTVSWNTADNFGSGIYNYSGTLTLTNCTVFENTAKYLIGGIYNEYNGTLTIIDSIISGNSGGGILNMDNSTLSITDSLVLGNTSISEGGGIYNCFYSTVTIADSIVSENTANTADGGIFNYFYSTMILANSTVSGNTANNYGGGICNIYYCTLDLTDSVVSGNTANYSGGIYHSYGSKLTLTNCTISSNTAVYGGGIYDEWTVMLTIINSIIAQNTALIPGNDIYNKDNNGPITAHNTLSSFTDWTESENCIVYDPSIPLFTDALHGDFTPAENSQAVNKGNNDYVETETDLAGNPRIYGGIVDIGAYEYQGTPSPAPTEQLAVPTITTGNRGIYVSYGANRHQITWTAVENASGYELAYTTDGVNWSSAWVGGTSGAVGNLTYGADVTYRVRALGEGPYINSDWSETKTFRVCPMDTNNDGDIGGLDRNILANSWGADLGDENYRFNADINGDGSISGLDRNFLAANWGQESDDEDLTYPQPLAAADTVFAEFASADLAVDLDVF